MYLLDGEFDPPPSPPETQVGISLLPNGRGLMFFVALIYFFLDQDYSRVLSHDSYFKQRSKSRLWPDGDDAALLYYIDINGIQHGRKNFPYSHPSRPSPTAGAVHRYPTVPQVTDGVTNLSRLYVMYLQMHLT